MTCSRELLEAHLDGELDAAAHAQVDEHLATCQECAATLSRLRDLQSGIRAQAPYYNAPEEVRRSVEAALRKEARTQSPSKPWWRHAGIAAAVLLVASLGWIGGRYSARSSEADTLTQTVVASHIRSLIGTHLMDVVSTDQHTVKPWFNGRLDFSPEVRDFAAQDFPLLGGRVDYLAKRTVAVLVYGRRKHVINLYIWPAGGVGPDSRTSLNGYNILHWTLDGMTYWAASDVSFADLDRFREFY